MKKVGFIKPGIIGGSMAGQLLAKGYELTVPMPLLVATREIYRQARKDGKGGQDFSAVTGRDQEEKNCAF